MCQDKSVLLIPLPSTPRYSKQAMTQVNREMSAAGNRLASENTQRVKQFGCNLGVWSRDCTVILYTLTCRINALKENTVKLQYVNTQVFPQSGERRFVGKLTHTHTLQLSHTHVSSGHCRVLHLF